MKKRHKGRKPKKVMDDSKPVRHFHVCTKCLKKFPGCTCKNSYFAGLCARCSGKPTEAEAIEEIMDVGAIKSIM